MSSRKPSRSPTPNSRSDCRNCGKPTTIATGSTCSARTRLLALVIGGAIWFYHVTRAGDLSLLWNVPVFCAAIVIVGALQHHLANLAHEAVHHTLFKNRYLNDMVSEWLCSFPMFSSTFHYGLHHLAHHQFVNDPVRDPDISQLQKSGHRLSFPIVRDEFLDVLFRQMWVPNLVRYSMARAEYDSLGSIHNPYIRADWEYTKLPARLSAAYLAAVALSLCGLVMYGNPLLLALRAAGGLGRFHGRAADAAGALLLPKQNSAAVFDPHARDDADHVPDRGVVCGCVGDLGHRRLVGRLFDAAVGRPAADHVSAVHGAAANRAARQRRPRLAHEQPRVFVPSVHQFRGLPAGAGLPLAAPHVFHDPALPAQGTARDHAGHPRIPRPGHGRRRLHLAEGAAAKSRPTVVDVLGPDYAPHEFRDVYIDNSVLEGRNVSEREKREILAEGAREAERVRQEARAGSWSLTDQPAHVRRSDVA